jgi:hypothetical protein
MKEKKTDKEKIISLAEQTKGYYNLLIKQCETWDATSNSKLKAENKATNYTNNTN